MNKDQLTGTVIDLAGQAKRKVGEATGDSRLQVEGSLLEVKGKLQKTWGDAKESVEHLSKTAKSVAESASQTTVAESDTQTETFPADYVGDHSQGTTDPKRRSAYHQFDQKG